MWPDTEDGLLATMEDLSRRAAAHGRRLDFGLRIHVVVRSSEAEARSAADRLMSRLGESKGSEIKHRAQDSRSAGVLRQDELREASKNDWIEPTIWSGIGRARSGCGSAIVGDPDQVVEKLERYLDLGIRSFILSGYPHLDECERVARWVLPRIPQCRLARIQGRLPETPPSTPLTDAPRS
jgi:alkanesulfonate monooxygenase